MNLADQFNSTPTGANLAAAFDAATPAETREPIPAGEYPARAVDSELGQSDKGTPFFKMRLEITSGEHAGRRLAAKWYLSGPAMPYTKRELAGLGLDRFAQLERGDVPGGLLRVRVALRRDDSGGAFNEVRAVLSAGGATGHPQTVNTAAPVVVAPPTSESPTDPVTVDDLPYGLADGDLL